MVTNFVFKGKYSDMAKELTGKTTNNATLFETLYDCMMFCVFHGIENNSRIDVETIPPSGSESASLATVRAEVIMNNLEKYNAMRKLIILSDKSRGHDFDTRVDYAMRYDIFVDSTANEEVRSMSKYTENSKLIESYVYGGLEKIYEIYKDHIKSYEEVVSKLTTQIERYIEETGVEIFGHENIDIKE